MSSNALWRITLDRIESRVAVGVHEHERTPQRILVDVMLEGTYPTRPRGLEECVSYECIYRYVNHVWPTLPHIYLLETLVVDLLEYIFRYDKRIVRARVKVGKPDIFEYADLVALETEWTRADYEKFTE